MLGPADTQDYAANLQEVLLELTSTKTSHRLEWIIILIIGVRLTLSRLC